MNARAVGLAVLLCLAASAAALTDKDVERIAAQWDEGEEEDEDDPLVKMRKREAMQGMQMPNIQPGQPIDPSAFQQMQNQGLKGQTKMLFATFDSDDRDDNERKAGLMADQLRNAHMHTKMYVIENDKVLFITEEGEDAYKIIDFLTNQEHIVEVEMDQKPFPGKKAKKKSQPAKEAPKDGARRRRRRRRRTRRAAAAKDEL